MRKIFISLCLMVVSASYLFSQEVLYQQDFEDYGTSTEWKLVQGDAVFEVTTVEGINNTTNMMSNSDVKQSILILDGKSFEGPFTIEAESYPSFNNAGVIVNYVDNDNFVCVTINNGDKRVRIRQVVNGIWDGEFDIADGGNGWPQWMDENLVSDSLGTDILAWSEGKPDLVSWKINVDPDKGALTIYINDNLIMEDVSVVLPQYKATVGIWTWWCRHAFDNVKITGAEKLVTVNEYTQDFEAANAGTEWSLVQGDAVFGLGTYADINNTSKMMVSTEVKQSILALNGYEFEGPFTLEMESYPSFNFAGPIVNYVDNDNFVCVTLDNNDKRVRVRQVVAGTWDGQFPVGDGNDWRFWKDDTYVSDSLGTDVLAWGENKPSSVNWKLLVDPDLGTLTVYIDNNLILKDVPVVLPQYKAKIGVYTWWCKHGFDNINISEGIDPGTSITKVIHKADFNIYPNPVLNGSLTIDATKISGSVNIIVYNVLGARVLSATEAGGNTIQLNVNNLKSGLYIVSLKGNNGISHQEKIYVK